jgi:murein DD-endopeptidase MepM/ murein hydrolase activator NlpD
MNRRALLAAAAGGAAHLALPARAAATLPFVVSGRPRQGGALIGRTLPGAPVAVNGVTVTTASPQGLFVIGLDRDERAEVQIAVRRYAGWEPRVFAVQPGDFDVQRIDGLPSEQVSPTAPAVLARIAREARLKAAAFASLDPGDGFKDGFDMPVQATRRSSSFGGQRILNGQPGRPHYGVDLAAPSGTPIRAPGPGLVVLAEPDLHFEGGLTLIDHGQGMIGMFLHQSRLLVRTGERVQRGQTIGAVGASGRATGPHLCWRLKWRDRNLDPSLLIGVAMPAGAADGPFPG